MNTTINNVNTHSGHAHSTRSTKRQRRVFAIAAATGVAALSLGVLGVAPANAAAPGADPTSAGAVESSDNGAILKDTRLTLVNNTDMSFRYTPHGSSTTLTLKPGESAVDQGDGSSIWMSHGQTLVMAAAFNHGVGTPDARGLIRVGHDESKRTEHQGVNEHDVLVEHHGLKLSSYRHADTKTKNFTITLDKVSAAHLTLDNKASATNAYVHVGGKMIPVKKHTAAQLPALTRGQNTSIHIEHGSQPTTVQVTWSGPVATFRLPGRPAVTLGNGDHASIGALKVSRVDTNHDATTAYTLATR